MNEIRQHDPTFLLVFMLASEFKYFQAVHMSLKRHGFNPGRLLAKSKADLECGLALYRARRKRSVR